MVAGSNTPTPGAEVEVGETIGDEMVAGSDTPTPGAEVEGATPGVVLPGEDEHPLATQIAMPATPSSTRHLEYRRRALIMSTMDQAMS